MLRDYLSRALEGEKADENLLFSHLLVRFTAIAKYHIGGEDAGDIAQDACLTVLQKYKSASRRPNFEAWAYTILRNKIGNYMKTQNRRRGIERELAERNLKQAALQISEADPLLERKLIDCLRKLIKERPQYARVLNLAHQGFESDEICRRLSVTRSNFYVLLHRSRSMLINCMENQWKSDQ